MQVDSATDAPHPVDVRIGEAVRAVRTAAGLSQTALAEAIEVYEQRGEVRSQPGISDWEYGKKPIGITELTHIEQALDLPRGYILVMAGLVAATEVEKAVAADPLLAPRQRRLVLRAYQAGVEQSPSRSASAASR